MTEHELEQYLARAELKFSRARALALLDEQLPEDLGGPCRPREQQAGQWKQALEALKLWHAHYTAGPKVAGGVILMGAVGRGKSRLMATLLFMAADLWGMPALYLNCKTIDAELRATFTHNPPEDARTEHQLLRLAAERPIIALDDAGATKGEHVARLMQNLLDLAAASNKFVVLTTNQTEADLAVALGNDQREQSRRAAFEKILFLPSQVPDFRRTH